jgi:Family of unknown function (DUF6526)
MLTGNWELGTGNWQLGTGNWQLATEMQSFKNHAYRPVLTGVGFVFVMIAVVQFARLWNVLGRATSLGLFALCGAVIVLLQISRRYTTRLQDRIIKLEMRVRTAPLLTPDQQRLLGQLNNKQIAALRFASDAELPALLERAVREKLPPREIKRAVTTWVPDLDRT